MATDVETQTVKHVTTVAPVEGRPEFAVRSCPCGYTGQPWRPSDAPGIRTTPGTCPNDRTVTALSTLQFHAGGLTDGRPVDGFAVHLVRSTPNGTPGPTLCGIDRFAPGAGWSVGGGVSGPGVVHAPCEGCAEVADRDFVGLPICGSVGSAEMAKRLGRGVTSW